MRSGGTVPGLQFFNDFKLKLLGQKAQHLAGLLVSEMRNNDGDGLGVLALNKTCEQLGIYFSQMFEGDLLLFFLELQDDFLGLVVFQHIRQQVPDELIADDVDPALFSEMELNSSSSSSEVSFFIPWTLAMCFISCRISSGRELLQNERGSFFTQREKGQGGLFGSVEFGIYKCGEEESHKMTEASSERNFLYALFRCATDQPITQFVYQLLHQAIDQK